MKRVVLDTNVFVAAIRSRRGASFALLSLVGQGRFQFVLSVPLVLEYEDAMKRTANRVGLRHADVDDLLDYLCQVGEHREVFFLWRPTLRDPKDDMVLELAVEAGCDAIVTHNTKDFIGIERFGIRNVRPSEFLASLEVKP
jgi:putative PIN family toxin of toxin-antitoxin system